MVVMPAFSRRAGTGLMLTQTACVGDAAPEFGNIVKRIGCRLLEQGANGSTFVDRIPRLEGLLAFFSLRQRSRLVDRSAQ
jgi:hypothetical protein